MPVLPDPDGAGQDALRDALADGVDLAGLAPAEEPRPLAGWRLRAPVSSPQKVLAIALNYADHAREAGVDPPQAPVTFVKTTNSVIGPGEAIRYHREDSTQVDYEAELAVVVGRRARRVGEGEALSHVFGYTACNDVSARDAQSADGQWVRAKSFDTFCPLGPWVVTADQVGDVQSLAIRCRVNGEVLQDGTTAEMIFPVAHLVSYLSQVMTLEPGDVISTGTPSGVGFARRPPRYLQDGDVVEVEVERVGVLRNPVQVE